MLERVVDLQQASQLLGARAHEDVAFERSGQDARVLGAADEGGEVQGGGVGAGEACAQGAGAVVDHEGRVVQGVGHCVRGGGRMTRGGSEELGARQGSRRCGLGDAHGLSVLLFDLLGLRDSLVFFDAVALRLYPMTC